MTFSNGSTKVAYFVAGCSMGAVLALLYAPRSGEATRRLLREKADQGRDALDAKQIQLREQAQRLFEKGKGLRKEVAEWFTGAFEAYKQAYYAALGG